MQNLLSHICIRSSAHFSLLIRFIEHYLKCLLVNFPNLSTERQDTLHGFFPPSMIHFIRWIRWRSSTVAMSSAAFHSLHQFLLQNPLIEQILEKTPFQLRLYLSLESSTQDAVPQFSKVEFLQKLISHIALQYDTTAATRNEVLQFLESSFDDPLKNSFIVLNASRQLLEFDVEALLDYFHGRLQESVNQQGLNTKTLLSLLGQVILLLDPPHLWKEPQFEKMLLLFNEHAVPYFSFWNTSLIFHLISFFFLQSPKTEFHTSKVSHTQLSLFYSDLLFFSSLKAFDSLP
jgi:hypothetical protein